MLLPREPVSEREREREVGREKKKTRQKDLLFLEFCLKRILFTAFDLIYFFILQNLIIFYIFLLTLLLILINNHLLNLENVLLG